MFSPLYRTFSGKKRTHFFKKVFLNLYRKFFEQISTPERNYLLLLYRSIYPENLTPTFGIIALLLLLGHLKSKTAHLSRKKRKKIAPASFSEADAISFRVFSCRSDRLGQSLRLDCGCCSSVRPIPFDSRLSAFR